MQKNDTWQLDSSSGYEYDTGGSNNNQLYLSKKHSITTLKNNKQHTHTHAEKKEKITVHSVQTHHPATNDNDLMCIVWCRAMWINVPGLITLVTICSIAGMVVYAEYRHCNPVTIDRIHANDQVSFQH